jgi:hypothetical protein
MIFPATPLALMIVVACIHIAIILPNGVVPAFIQLVTPRTARSQVSAVYVLVINLVGLGLAPLAIGALSARYPADPHALRFALWVCVTLSIAMAFLALLGLQAVVRRAAVPGDAAVVGAA